MQAGAEDNTKNTLSSLSDVQHFPEVSGQALFVIYVVILIDDPYDQANSIPAYPLLIYQ